MQRIFLTAATALALGAPAFADGALQPDAAVVEAGEEHLIDLDLVSVEELEDATVYFANGEDAGDVVDVRTQDGAIHSLLVHDFDSFETVIDRYLISAEQIAGYEGQERTVILRINNDGG